MPLWYQSCRNAIKILHALVGLGVFGYAYRRKGGGLLRLFLCALLSFGTAYLVQRWFYVPGITLPAITSQVLVSLVDYLIVLEFSHLCLWESIWTRLFVTTAALTAQGMGGCVKAIAKLVPAVSRLSMDNLGILLVDLFCFGGVYLILFFVFRPFTQNREEILGDKRKVIFSTLVLLFYLATTWFTRDYTSGQSRAQVIVSNIQVIVTQGMIYVLQFGMMERGRMSRYIEVMQELLHEQRSQYESSRESVQLINEKYHDLKNMLASLQGVVPGEELGRLKTMISRYDVHVKTGSQVLDVVVAQKLDLCLQRGISMTCHFGQADFAFMEELDLYTLFNNALTNAIQAVCALPDSRDRYILVCALQDENMVSVHVENPCQRDIRFVDGLPQTTGDTKWHGFGMKSMERTAQKYGGAISVSQEEGRFQLDILLLNPACDS